ncbi:hypothetical protein Tco_0016212 [Tanacetum coccineum]
MAATMTVNHQAVVTGDQRPMMKVVFEDQVAATYSTIGTINILKKFNRRTDEILHLHTWTSVFQTSSSEDEEVRHGGFKRLQGKFFKRRESGISKIDGIVYEVTPRGHEALGHNLNHEMRSPGQNSEGKNCFKRL